MSNSIRNKNLYKLFITIIKVIPIVLAILEILGLILSYFGMTSFIITCFGGVSISYLIILYLISLVFGFCGLYRLSLNYITCTSLISIYDFYFKIPLDLLGLYSLYAVITGVFLISWVIYWYTHRNNPKIDHIKQLCDNVCC